MRRRPTEDPPKVGDACLRRLGSVRVEITRDEATWLTYAAHAGMSVVAELTLLLRERKVPTRRSPVIVVRESSR